jgi:putative phosphoribosyl transferase
MRSVTQERYVRISPADVELEGDLSIPDGASGIVLFAHGSGSSRHSPRNRYVGEALRRRGLGTLLFDLLTLREERLDMHTGHLRFDIDLLSERLVAATEWIGSYDETRDLRIGYFGASTGAAAALVAAARLPEKIGAIVSRGGRPDLAGPALRQINAPTLLIVGGDDLPVIELNRRAQRELHAPNKLEIVPGATHLFEEPGALDQVAALAGDWFVQYLRADAQTG